MSEAAPGRLIVLSGPSGVGKDTVLHEVFRLQPALRRSVSYTTRSPRPGEREGEPYSFVDRATFEAMIERGEFLEYADVYGHLYGTSLRRVREAAAGGAGVVLKIDVQGAARVRQRIGGEALYIFLAPPSAEELRRRLFERGEDDPESLELRWKNAVREMAEQGNYDHVVVNREVSQAAAEVSGIIVRSLSRPDASTAP